MNLENSSLLYATTTPSFAKQTETISTPKCGNINNYNGRQNQNDYILTLIKPPFALFRTPVSLVLPKPQSRGLLFHCFPKFSITSVDIKVSLQTKCRRDD